MSEAFFSRTEKFRRGSVKQKTFLNPFADAAVAETNDSVSADKALPSRQVTNDSGEN